MKNRLWLVLPACVLSGHASALEYTVRTLRHPNAGQTSGSQGTSVNNKGQVCGDAAASNGFVTACVWNPNGTFLALPDIPGGTDAAIGLSINASGSVAGYGTIGQVLNSAALWVNGQVLDLGTLPLHNKSSFALGINDAGTVVGRCARDFDNRVLSTAFVWQSGVMGALPHLDDFQSWSEADGSNLNGVIVGSSRDTNGVTQPVFWQNGIVHQLPQLPTSASNGFALDINEAGVISGASYDSFTNLHAVVWMDGQLLDLGKPDESSICKGINELNQVVGTWNKTGKPEESWIWALTIGRLDIRPLTQGINGWLDIFATDLNDKGQVCGVADVPNPSGSGYHREGFLLTPVSTVVAPSTVTVLFGQKQSGNAASLATIDGNTLRVCRFLVPNQQTDPVQVRVEAVLPWQPMNLWFKATAKSASAGAFTWSLNLYDWTTNLFDPATNSTAGLSAQNSELETIAKGDISRYVRSSDRKVWALLRARAVGPTASLSWCVDIDQAAWEAVPLP